MGEIIISRRGQAGKSTELPTITFVSKTTDEIVVNFTNNDTTEAEIYYGLQDPPTTIVTLASGATSSNVTFSALTNNTQYTIFAYAIVTDPTLNKVKSETASLNVTTDPILYTVATGGTILDYDSGGTRYRSHTFTSTDDFVVTQTGNENRNEIDYLIIAGGGAGGTPTFNSGQFGGGGGAGGYRTTNGTSGGNSSAESKVTISNATYTITIGAGGAIGNSSTPANGENGNITSIVGGILNLTTVGGGGGGHTLNNVGQVGSDGGSGGGGGAFNTTGVSGGAGTSSQGFGGGPGGLGLYAAGGGGGAGQFGPTGAGGAGLNNLLRTGSNEARAGGGGGGGLSHYAGGTGGGGQGADQSSSGTAGAVNTGSGGGGGNGNSFPSAVTGDPGGSGIVIISYEIAPV